MTPSDFTASVSGNEPPAVATPLQALWWDRKGDWGRAHGMVNHEAGNDAAWVHAYLHRKEGDQGNARYWYSRAGKRAFAGPLDDEWAAIARVLLDQAN